MVARDLVLGRLPALVCYILLTHTVQGRHALAQAMPEGTHTCSRMHIHTYTHARRKTYHTDPVNAAAARTGVGRAERGGW